MQLTANNSSIANGLIREIAKKKREMIEERQNNIGLYPPAQISKYTKQRQIKMEKMMQQEYNKASRVHSNTLLSYRDESENRGKMPTMGDRHSS